MRQKDTRRLLQMVETTAKVPILEWQDDVQSSTGWLQSLQKGSKQKRGCTHCWDESLGLERRRDPEKAEELVLSEIILLKVHMKAPETMAVRESCSFGAWGAFIALSGGGAEGNILPCSLTITDLTTPMWTHTMNTHPHKELLVYITNISSKAFAQMRGWPGIPTAHSRCILLHIC